MSLLLTPQDVIDRRKKLIYELLENIPAKHYVTVTSIQNYLTLCGEPMKSSSVLLFITNYCLDIYEDDGPGFYFYGLTEDHEYSEPPEANKLLLLQDFYITRKPNRGKRKKVSA